MRLFRLRFIKIQQEVILPVYVLRNYFYIYRHAYVLLRDRLSTLSIQQAVWL